ncbi:MAG TPA: homocysteine S-methyltransferase family protein, partial [Terriglobia bacterium]|nr:homocysteine S-methyltransferase family protein [Terriglobia bacterium]
LEWARLGAQVLGGCCGTTPKHIGALKEGLPKTLPA